MKDEVEEYYEVFKLKIFEYDTFRNGYYPDGNFNEIELAQDYIGKQKEHCKIFKVTETKHYEETK